MITHYIQDNRPLCDKSKTPIGAFIGTLNWELVNCPECLKQKPPVKR